MPYTKEELGNLTFQEIDKLYKEDIFTEEFAKNLIEGKFISYKPMNIAGRAGFLVVYEVINERMGMKIKMRNISQQKSRTLKSTQRRKRKRKL